MKVIDGPAGRHFKETPIEISSIYATMHCQSLYMGGVFFIYPDYLPPPPRQISLISFKSPAFPAFIVRKPDMRRCFPDGGVRLDRVARRFLCAADPRVALAFAAVGGGVSLAALRSFWSHGFPFGLVFNKSINGTALVVADYLRLCLNGTLCNVQLKP